MNISSGSAFGPIQPQLPDFSALDEKIYPRLLRQILAPVARRLTLAMML